LLLTGGQLPNFIRCGDRRFVQQLALAAADFSKLIIPTNKIVTKMCAHPRAEGGRLHALLGG
jgi:hypothetical protein